MRIALVAPGIPDYSIEYAVTLSTSANVLLCIADKFANGGYPQPTDNLAVDWLSWPRQRDFLGNVSFMRRLARRIREWKPDAVHILMEDSIWTNVLPRLLGRIPVMTTIHDVLLHPGDVSTARVPRFFIKSMAKQSDAIVVHGEALRADAQKVLPVSDKKCYVFPHPPLRRHEEVAREEGFSKPDDGIFRVLFFGRIYKYKGLRYLLQAAVSLEKTIPRIKFIVAGAGDDMANYSDLLANLSCVEIHNRFIQVTEGARLFSEADLLVLPYIEASQSGVLMMAMAFGLPVVATDVGAIAETVKSTGMGLLVPPADDQALAAAIGRIASDAALRSRLSESAALAGRESYGRLSLGTRALNIYKDLLTARAS